MKADIHPEYREVVFQDISSDFAFLTRSTIHSKETIKWEDGKKPGGKPGGGKGGGKKK